jgi:hypothetical protein
VEACPTDAFQFGEEADFADQLQDAVVLQPAFGTAPRVYYRNIPGQFVGGLLYDPVEEEVLIGATCRLEGTGLTLETKTDDFGDFWFKNLPVGRFTLTVSANGFRSQTFRDLDTTKCVNLGDIPMERA